MNLFKFFGVLASIVLLVIIALTVLIATVVLNGIQSPGQDVVLYSLTTSSMALVGFIWAMFHFAKRQ